MKLLNIALVGIMLNYVAHAQDKQSIAEKIGNPDSFILLGQFGTAVSNYSDKGTHIERYNAQAEFLWKASVPTKYSGRDFNVAGTYYDLAENFLVGTLTGSWIYNIQIKPTTLYKKPSYVAQIGKDGSVKNFTIEAREELGKTLQSVFCDEQYLYIMTTDNGDEREKKKKVEEKLILNRFDAKDFSYKRIVLDLPSIEKGTSTSFWIYLGQTPTEKYLVSKNINHDDETAVFTIVAFDANGKIIRTFKLEPKLEGKFLRPASNIHVPSTNFHQVSQLDYYVGGSHGYLENFVLDCGFSNIDFDPLSENFYISGLTGPKSHRLIASVYDGFYIFKYDVKGTLRWGLQQPASPELSDESFFRIHGTPGSRSINLKVVSSNFINFSIHFKKILFTYAINADGKATSIVQKDDYTSAIDNFVITDKPLKSVAYLKRLDEKNKKHLLFTNFLTTQGEVLFEVDGKLKLLYFKN